VEVLPRHRPASRRCPCYCSALPWGVLGGTGGQKQQPQVHPFLLYGQDCSERACSRTLSSPAKGKSQLSNEPGRAQRPNGSMKPQRVITHRPGQEEPGPKPAGSATVIVIFSSRSYGCQTPSPSERSKQDLPILETRSLDVGQAGLKLSTLLPYSPQV
jgi:hypothetical protein